MLNENGTIIAYDGDDTTEDFPFVSSTGEAIHFREYSHVHGIEIDTNGVETPVVFSTNYEISGKPNNGVLHRIDGPLPTGYKLIIWREQPIEQSVRFGTGGNFRASDHEAAADNIVQMLQEIRFDVARSIKLPRQAKLQDVEVPLVDGQAPVVHIDVDGNASIQGEDPGGDGSGGGSVSEFAQTILQADNALEAQEALGLTPGREIVGGYAIAKHHGGGRWRAFWSTDQSRIVVYGDTVGLGIDPAGDNWGPFVIAWSPLTNGNITAMYAGTNYLLIQTDLATGNLFHIGYTDNGQGGNGLTAGYSLEPQRITKFVTDAVKIADVTTEGNVDQVEKFWFAVTTGGAVYSCGYSGSQHVMGYNSATNLSTPRKMTLSDGTTALADVTEIYAATAYAPVWARTSTRKAYRWGAGTDGAHGDNSTSAMTWPEYLETFAGSGVAREDIAEVAVSGGSSDTTHACSWILTTDGNVLSAGANNYGNGNGASLGDTDQTTFTAATGAIASVTVEKIRAGGGSRPICVAITDDGDIYLVGRNGAGLRGSGSTADLSEFTKIVDLATGFDGNVVDARVAGAYKTSADYSVLYIEALVNGATKISGIGYDTEYAPGAGSTGVAANLRTHEIVLNLPDTITSWQSVGDATVFGLEVTTGIGEVWYVGGNDQGQAGHMPGNMHAVVTMQPSNRVAGQGNGVPLATVAAATATAAATTASAAATSASASATASASSAAAAAASEASASTSAGAASASAAVAQAAAESSGNINYYDTKADADAALSGLAEDQVVEVFIDETRNDNRTRYRVESGVYVYKFTFPTAKPIPADSFVAATDKGVIQAALNFAGLSPGSTVQLTPGRTYTLTHTGTKSFESGTHRYCVEIPAGVRLDLNGATVKLDDAQNSALFMNAGAGTTQDFGTQVYGGTLDGNETNQTDGGSSSEMPLIFMYDCDHIEIRHIRAVNARDGFGRFIKDRDSTFDYLWGKRSDGYGWSFGV
ncbi:MAG: hypothetical protein KDI55_00415, partial [Anaerolineae bacterium]|nr:hypothetical protein [Anaerolineae bacterium]